MRTFQDKLYRALTVLEDDDQLAKDANLNQLATKLTGDASAVGKKQSDQQVQRQQRNTTLQNRANQLYQQYQAAKQDSDKAEKEAAARQDVALYNKAASARKRMEDTYKAYQLAQQQVLNGGQNNPTQAAGMPPEAAASAAIN